MNDNIQRLIDYDDLYYNEGESPISDEEYDTFKDKVKLEQPTHPYFNQVGATVKGEKVKLPFVLGSLNKVTPDTVEKWLAKQDSQEYLVTEKLDGVDFIVTYFHNEVVFAATRGDGYYGQDITEKAKIFCPKITGTSETLHIRGQAMLLGGIHESLGYKTARNGAAGVINHKSSNKNCEHITPMFFEIIEGFEGNELDKYNMLDKLFNSMVPDFEVFRLDHTSNPIDTLKRSLELFKFDRDYEIDGLVLTPLNYERENVLLPESKCAFKVNEDAVVATITGIEWNVSRTGRIVPVVLIEPTEIQGVTISRATGFNAKFIYGNMLGKGSLIGLQRSGDVIPFIKEVYTPSNSIDVCSECPSCSNKTEWKGVDIVCTNPECVEQAYYKVEHFLRRMGAENITYKTLMKLGLDTIEKCYEIDEWEIASIDGFGVKRAQQIVNEIQGTLHTTFDKVIAAYGMPGVGRSVGKAIADRFSDPYEFFENATLRNMKNILEIDGIGEIIAKTIADNILDFYNYVEMLYLKGMTFEEGGKKMFDGVKFCLTGKGPMSRGALQTLITGVGGVVKGISKTTDYLVIADPESQSGKAKKAQQYGVKIISYEELIEMLG